MAFTRGRMPNIGPVKESCCLGTGMSVFTGRKSRRVMGRITLRVNLCVQKWSGAQGFGWAAAWSQWWVDERCVWKRMERSERKYESEYNASEESTRGNGLRDIIEGLCTQESYAQLDGILSEVLGPQ